MADRAALILERSTTYVGHDDWPSDFQIIDTTLAKLLADANATSELLELLTSPNEVVLNELEPFLDNQPYILSTVMAQQGHVERELELLKL